MELQIGLLFHNRYYLVELIGTGSSAEVWKAKDIKANNLIVALKIFLQNSEIDSYGFKNFEKEFTTVYNMKHSNLLPPTGYDIFNGMPYLVMQYCDNGSCNSMIGRTDEEDIIRILHDVSAGLEYLHDHNIIHQDIKPDNILLDDNCNFMVTDFGISISTIGDVGESNEMSGGTRAYMAPERFEGRIYPSSDIWSLGATIVELLTGNPPYGQHGGLLQAEGESLPELPNKLHPEVKKIIFSCLSKNPSHRIKANEIRQKIETYRETGSWVKHSQKKSIIILSTILASILMCLGIFMWDYNRTKVYYFKDYVECWGCPEGIGRIMPWTTKHMTRMYKFEYKRGKVIKVSHVNSFDNIISDGESERNERPINQEIFYSSEGKVSRIKVKDNNDKILYIKSFNENLTTMSFQYGDNYNTEKAISSASVSYSRILESETSQKGKITRWLLEYDKKGRVIKLRYATLDNSEVSDNNNIYGRTMTYDSNNRISEIHYINKNNDPQQTRWGLGIKKFYYDKSDNWIRAEYFTSDGQRSFDDIDGVSIFEMEYDEYGNVISAYHKDTEGRYMLPKKNGIAGVNYNINNSGLIIETTFLGINKQPIYVESIGAAGYTIKYDENGYPIEQVFFDPDKKICESNEGNSKVTFVNDKKGNQLETWNYDKLNNLCLNSHGIAGIISKYDSLGNQYEVVFYGKDSLPTLNEYGEAGIRIMYDERNFRNELIILGRDLNPSYNNNNVCRIKYQYDKRGNMTQIAFYDETGTKLVHSGENVAGWKVKYDDFGNELERTFFNSNYLLCEIVGGYAKLVHTYDQNEHIKSTRFFNINNKLTIVDGIAGTDYVCDDRGNVIIEKPLSISGNLAEGKQEIHYKYDKFDNNTEISYFNNGKPVSCSQGYHHKVITYNNRNLITEIAYYNTKSKPCLTSNEGIAKLKYEYDERGNCTKTYYYGINNQPIIGKEGWASSTYEYDEFGNITKQCFYDIEGQPTNPQKMVPVGVCKYDKFNKLVFIASQDGKGNYINNPNTGWAILKMSYNVQGKITEKAYYNSKEEPTLVKGVHIERYEYDEKGLMIYSTYYNINDKPTNNSLGYFKVIINYDNGVPCLRKFLSVNGELIDKQSYNKNKGTWNFTNTASSDWREIIKSANKECPTRIENGIYIQSITAKNNTVEITIQFSELSKYNIDYETNTKLKSFCSIAKSKMREFLNLSSGISIHIVITDKVNRPIEYEEF